ncbi:UDP-N-acetylmuramoyl-tripeptide--D-alanyl-D-alanine ligase [Secundilactobacillus oryzae JCM 18671]|uniref:UDP-N-acetylmuramoyl-tripeptide--D-alanyl-D-alanine ligase n=1 Tax=Secundilactobacillus oryzae JCM 18671 TaxID=1291743 RepID=A0A081BH37_9LACO|nr:UDP-N-acetylmuramoyl-tripeptide--D-alanyl-D-alanine ligase [Secundilactobacillus oryzae]GAK47355.1 UDP-N-acetylmuramoyl-tripeptide--D-alanyl-D-alanine ligase [Secundilactobacillus oryzae JCM 18671]
MKMQLAEIAKAVNAENDIERWKTLEVSSVSFDSREVTEGALFVPLMGERDGHTFVDSAAKNGAVATFWCRDHTDISTDLPVIVVKDTLQALQDLSRYYLMKINPRVVAVTGSNGKTTTKDMIAALLATQFNVTKTQDNFNNEIGVPVTILSMEPTTELLVVEMGMDRPGQLEFLSKLAQPDLAVITMIGEAHIEFFGTRDKIADAKMEITSGLKADGVFIYNGDEPLLRERAEAISQYQRTFGREAINDFYPTDIVATPTATSFKTNRWPDETFEIPLIGEYNVNNALAALAVAATYQIRPENMHQALKDFDITENRTEWMKGARGEQILSDVYNSNPTAVKEVLSAFIQVPAKRKRIAVLGDMLELGTDADAMHAELADYLHPDQIQSLYLIGTHMKALENKLITIYPSDSLHYFPTTDLSALIMQLDKEVTEDDLVLLKGSHGIHLEEALNALK